MRNSFFIFIFSIVICLFNQFGYGQQPCSRNYKLVIGTLDSLVDLCDTIPEITNQTVDLIRYDGKKVAAPGFEVLIIRARQDGALMKSENNHFTEEMKTNLHHLILKRGDAVIIRVKKFVDENGKCQEVNGVGFDCPIHSIDKSPNK